MNATNKQTPEQTQNPNAHSKHNALECTNPAPGPSLRAISSDCLQQASLGFGSSFISPARSRILSLSDQPAE
jgi:hypothetical protein